MDLPIPFIPQSDSETPAIPVNLTKIPTVAQVSGHMMISYDNPVEWGTEEELTQMESAQRTTWAGKKESGWSGVEYFKITNPDTAEEEARLLAVPGSWARTSNETLEAFVLPAQIDQEFYRNLAHGLVTHPELSWEKPVSNRDTHRIAKAILFRSILIQTRTLPSNAQLNTLTKFLLESEETKEKILEAKKEGAPTEPLILTPAIKVPPLQITEEEEQGIVPLPEIPAPPQALENPPEEINIVQFEETPDPQKLLEIAKRVLPASRILEARGVVTNAAEDAIKTATDLINKLKN